MVEPNQELLADERVPRVTLAGREWPVPKFAIAQNSVILPLLMEHFDRPELAYRSTDGIVRLGTVIFTALGRGHRGMTREQFDDMAIEIPEMAAAIRVIAQQTGLFKSEKESTNGVSLPLPEALSTTPTGPQ
jgi:hypothetical protein